MQDVKTNIPAEATGMSYSIIVTDPYSWVQAAEYDWVWKTTI